MPHPPHPRSRFFDQTVFEGQSRHDLLQSRCLAAKVFDLVRGCGPRRIASEPLFTGLNRCRAPRIIEVLDDPLTAAELSDAFLAAQALQDDADPSAEACNNSCTKKDLGGNVYT